MSRQQVQFPLQQLLVSTPASPPSGSLKLYPKTDGQLYKLNSSGVESPVAAPYVLPEPLVVNNATVNQVLTVGQRIKGDFSNATFANRTVFQTSTANSLTEIAAIPSGTGTGAYWEVFNASDQANSSGLWVGIDTTRALIQTTKLGTAPYVPLAFFVGGAERMKIDTTGAVTIPGTLGVTGAISGSNVNLTGQLSMPQGNAIYWADTNSRIMSSGRATYFDEYNAGWYWRNSATSFSNTMSLGGAGGLTVAAGLTVSTGQMTVSSGRLHITRASTTANYNDSNMEIVAPTPNQPGIGFHESGSSATTLYKRAGTEQLWQRYNSATLDARLLTTVDQSTSWNADVGVQRYSGGSIGCGPIYMPTGAQGGVPAYIAGQSGDGWIRWWPKSVMDAPALNWAQLTTSAPASNQGAWQNCTFAGSGNAYCRNDSSQMTPLKAAYFSIFAAGGGYYAVGVRIVVDGVVVASQTGNSNDYCPCGTGWTGYVGAWVQVHRYGGVGQGAATFHMTYVPSGTYP